ncbi:MAG: creatininase family protein [Saprospiraceae bacterium]|nr:creatininase family protein [Saprospiraceae bacterium]MBL0024140.1 creatininase family protein [Saprospiraceae bacterium]
MRPYILAETNWKFVRDQKIDLAVLPWGATEAHNFHLPYSTDVIEAHAMAAGAAKIAYEKGAKVMVLPTIPFGVNTGQHDVKFDININPSTQMAILDDIINTLNRQGTYKLVILNSHGGNDFRQILRELGLKYQDMFLSEVDWYKVKDIAKIFNEPGDHAGEAETSMMLFLKPEWVLPLNEAGEGKAKKFRFEAMAEGWAWAERHWTSVTTDTGIGNPSQATPEKGEQFLKLLSQKLGDYLFEVATTDKKDFYK